MDSNKVIVRLAVAALVAAAVIHFIPRLSGVMVWVALGMGAAGLIYFIEQVGRFFGLVPEKVGEKNFHRLKAVAASFALALTMAEGALQAVEYYKVKTGGPGAGRVMPKDWELRPADVPGAQKAYYWQGKLHVENEYRMRRSTPFPPKRPGVFRIMVVGDSLTYGSGVDASETYPSVLESLLSTDYRVEVLNLGIGGYQSENILWVIRTFLPQLQPDLVVYGVCLNDFLPSRVGQYSTLDYPFPLPEKVKDFLAEKTLLGGILSEAYNRFLLSRGLRHDFYTDILDGINGYQQKFDRDVRAMNQFVTGQGLPPVVAMVVHQEPRTVGAAWRLAKLAETYLQLAGMTVIPVDDYFKANDGSDMRVSRWEGHPSAKAQRIFAEEFAAKISGLPPLQAYRK